MPDRNANVQLVTGAFPAVVVSEAFTQTIGLDPDNGIAVLIESFPASEYIQGDRILFDLAALSSEHFLAQIREQAGEGRGTHKQ